MTSDFWVDTQVGHGASDCTKQAYVVKYLIRHRELKLDGAIGHFAEPL